MSVAVRTQYDNVAVGALDPLWVGKVQAGGSGTVKTVTAPWGGRAQEHIVHDGDVLYGGERCEVLNGRIGSNRGGGTRLQLGFGIWLPADFDSSDSGWNSLFDFHYSGNDIQQSPITGSIRNDREFWVSVKGGPFNGIDRGKIEKAGKLADLELEKLHTILLDIYFSMTDGIFDCWVDDTKRASWRTPTITTDHGENSTYWKQGFYRSQSEAGTERYLFDDTVCWYNADPSEMLAFYSTNGGGTPPPDPTPTPGAVSARCSIQEGQTLLPEKQPVSTAINAGNVDAVSYLLDGQSIATSLTGPSYLAQIDLSAVTPGVHTFGFVCSYKGKVVLDTWKAYPVTIAGAPVPPPQTNRQHADKALAAFKRATVTYPEFEKRLAAGKYPEPLKTAWGEGLHEQGLIT